MSEATHTPGPWFYEYTGIGHTVRQSPTAPLSLMVVNHSENPEADGRLIAAAPELLEALHALQEIGALEDGMLGEHGGIPEAQAKARAAIAKVTGTP